MLMAVILRRMLVQTRWEHVAELQKEVEAMAARV